MSEAHTNVRAGYVQAVAAAVLFGLSAPAAKVLLRDAAPVALAGLFYAGAGALLALLWLLRRAARTAREREAPLRRRDLWALAGGITAGGVVGPALLLLGLARTAASTASLLLNLEAVLTILLARFWLREHLSTRQWLASGLIVAAAAALGFDAGGGRTHALGVACVAGACLCWAIDNTITRGVSLRDPYAIARTKGLVAGPVLLVVAALARQPLPRPGVPALVALGVGGLSYGVSLVLYVRAVRALGSARTGALFATAPFAGLLGAVALTHERLGLRALVSGAAMLLGAALLVLERHAHEHTHAAQHHEHAHVHDAHHQHAHRGDEGPEPHSHPHDHAPLRHAHEHAEDAHHRHAHD